MIEQIAAQIKNKLGAYAPETAIILGSGLGALGDQIENPVIIPYGEIEGFPQSTVSGHKGRLIIGRLEGKDVLCMQGRIHLYEGHSPQSINTFIKAFQLLGIQNLIVTNASGSLTKDLPAGSIMLIKDHINLSGTNPLIGPNDEAYGPRFPDMSNAYDKELRAKAKELAKQENIPLAEGIYLMVSGPTFETPAEVRAFRILGADVVGMSTVPEIICAVHSGIKVLGFSVVVNLGCGLKDGAINHAETLREADKASVNLIKLVRSCIREI